MYYTTFVKKTREQVQEQLGEKYQVEIVTNSKLNGAEKTGLTIRRMQEPQQVVPVLYIVRISEVEIGNIKITNKMLEMWGISAEELDNQAMDNMKTDGYQVKGMRCMLQETCLEMMGDIVEEEDEVMYVLTNKEKYFGAAGIFFCAELFQKVIGTNNFYILPSSVHELILVKDDGECDMQELNAMVRCVNEEQVDIDERLSDHEYYYDWKQNRVIF